MIVWSPVFVPVTLPLRVPDVIVAPFMLVAVATQRDGVVNEGGISGASTAGCSYASLALGYCVSVEAPEREVTLFATSSGT